MDVIICFLVSLLNFAPSASSEDAPRFLSEPPFRVEFSNSSGGEVRCSAGGGARVAWQTREGAPARDVPGLRYVRGADATLVFPPFGAGDFRQDVHDTAYRCVAESPAGAIVSRDTHVKGVVLQSFVPQVYDDYVIAGNTGVLRCHFPSFARDHVTVEWSLDDTLLLPKDSTDDKFTVLSTGELLIGRVEPSDGRRHFRCRARHRLTGALVLSPKTAKILVTEPHSTMSPRISFVKSQVRAEEGSFVTLPCVSQARPAPEYKWFRDAGGQTLPVGAEEGEARVRVVWGTLHIRGVTIADQGKYECVVSNTNGRKNAYTDLIVTAPLRVSLLPPLQTLNIGESAVLNCSVSGHPVHSVAWRKDLRPLVADARVQLPARDVLHITSVRREDRGMYQCFAYNDADAAQGAAQLKIGDVPPYLLSAFPDTTVHQGEFVSLKCVSAGNFVPRVTWSLFDTPIAPSQRIRTGDTASPQGHVTSYLNITGARAGDGGVYRCDVSNEVGAVWHAARLHVHGPPFARPPGNVSAVSGRDLRLECPVGGHPIKSVSWQKGGIMLPLDHRHQMASAGSLVISGVQKAADEGTYTCTARSPDGQAATGTTHVAVLVAPVIDSQFFPDTVTATEGERAKMICSATTGDPPIRFRWLKNGMPYSGGQKATIQLLEDSSVLLFRRVRAEDRGQYTCVATNEATSTNMTSQLVVNVPPGWVAEPSNTSAVLGSSAWMNCSAEGFPTPSVIWRKARESGGPDFGYVTSSPRIRQYNNGSLVLWDVELSDRGSYLCQASNGIGASLSKVVFLDVQVPPKFEETYQSKAIKEGDNTSLRCTATGNTPIVITWQKNKTPVPVTVNSKYSLKEITDDSRMTSELFIASAMRDEGGEYTCAASNDFGSAEATIQLIVQGVPDPPTNLTAVEVTSRTLTLTWEVPFNGNSHVTGSSVQYKMADEGWKGHLSQLIVSGGASRAVLRSLHPLTAYQVRVIADNEMGKSRPSDILNVTTLLEAPSGPPTELSVHPTGDQSLKVTWKTREMFFSYFSDGMPPAEAMRFHGNKLSLVDDQKDLANASLNPTSNQPPREDARHGQIQGYQVGWREYPSSAPYQRKGVEADDPLATYVTGLRPFTQYEVTVSARNAAGAGPDADSVVATTLESAPPTSPVLQVINTSHNSITVRWEKASKDRITEYTLHYQAEGVGEWQRRRLPSAADRFALEGARCGTRYTLFLTAANSLGTGEPSPHVNARTKGAAPMPAPQSSFVTPNTTWAQLHLSLWSSGGCPIQGFELRHRPRFHAQWSAPTPLPPSRQTAPLHQLSPDREYVVMVTAKSEAGATQAEYAFRTMPLPYSTGGSSLRESPLPFHRNVTLLIPVVVSSLVLIIVVFAVAICLRKHTPNNNPEYDSPKVAADSLLMSEVASQKPLGGGKQASSHYSSPARGQHKEQHRRADKQHEYAEPYTAYPSSRQRSDEGSFATIKRAPPRSGSMTSAYKTDLLMIEIGNSEEY